MHWALKGKKKPMLKAAEEELRAVQSEVSMEGISSDHELSSNVFPLQLNNQGIKAE